MMMMLCSSNGLQAALTAAVYLMIVLSTCSARERTLHLTEKIEKKSVIFRTIDMKVCQTGCIEDAFIFSSWHRSRDDVNKTGGSGALNHKNAVNTPLRSKACNMTSPYREGGCRKVYNESYLCLEVGCGKACVGASFSCELHNASRTGNLSKVKLILSHGRPDINCKDCIGRTPVMRAAAEGHREVVQFLVSSGANISLVDRFDINILHLACLRGHVEVVKYVLSQTMLDINSRVQCNRTAVMLAAENRHRDVVELLVDKGADVSLVDETGDNLLHCACRGGDVEVVKYILSKNRVDIDKRGLHGMTAIMVARKCEQRDVVELLVSKRADGSLRYYNHLNMLRSACTDGDMEVVKYVLSQKIADINSRGWRKKTPVMLAAERGHKDVVELLVENGADLSLVYDSGSNILHLACSKGHLEVVKYILSQNVVDINSRGWGTRTPVISAAEYGHKEVVELLVDNGADLSLVTGSGSNILHFACSKGHLEVVKYVLSQNVVDVNSRGIYKRTPVMLAAERGHKDVVELLVENGADLSLESGTGGNILHLACSKGHLEVVKYVVSQNIVDINKRGTKNMTPIMMAKTSGHTDVVAFLLSRGADVS